MTRSPEEVFDLQVWEILQAIKGESLAANEDGSFFYETTKTVIVAGEINITRERKWAIVRKLAREKAVEIINEIIPGSESRNGFYLKLIEPKFSQFYDTYKRRCDVTSYLNDYQERLIKGDNTPPGFLQVENSLAKTKEPASESTHHVGKMFEEGSGGGYYNRSHPPNQFSVTPTPKVIVDGFSPPNYTFVLIIIEGILSASEFCPPEKIHYQLQSPPGQLLMQERQLLTKFDRLGLFRHCGEDGIYAIATLRNLDIETLRGIVSEIRNRQQNAMPVKEEKSNNLKAKYDKLIGEIKEASRSNKERQRQLDETINRTKLSLEEAKRKAMEDAAKLQQSDKKLTCGGLSVDLEQGTVQFKDNPVVEISPGNNVVKLLVILMKVDKIVEYIEIARILNLGCWHENVKNEDVRREVQFLKRDLVNFLKKEVSMSDSEIRELIIPKTNVGYKLRHI